MTANTPSPNLYKDGYRDFNPTWHLEDSPWKARKIIEVIPEGFYQTLPRGIRIIDIGCGAGEILKLVSAHFVKRGFSVEAHGYDIAEEPLTYAHTAFPEAAFHNKEFEPEEYLSRGQTIDITLLIDILEHLPNPDKILRDISTVARYAVCHIPLEDNIEVRLRGLHKKFEERVGHIQHYNLRSARALMTTNGFSIVTSMFTCLDYDADYTFKSLPRRILAQPVRRLFFRRFPGFTANFLGNVSIMALLKNAAIKEKPV